ncbi:hypothetical protein MSAN_00563200 [Mycena sanguinolenta]|uniref:Uncharacterized protein n=1 Tax=Mycena sanguinolenta TaxID=230812 RepID=A0A8H7DIH8_9AGAR|nr:hypothetical protein MSAN_00563200 [Mycena sanguinolenta]
MGGRKQGAQTKWNTEQLEFLLGQYPAFEAAQRSTKLQDFWPKVEREYFVLWPEEDVLGIVVPEDDGSEEAPAAMSKEDAKRLGEATAARKKVEIFQKRNKRLIDDTVKEKLAKEQKKAKAGSNNDDDGSSSDDDSSSDDKSRSSSDDDDSSSSDDGHNSRDDDEVGCSKSAPKPKLDGKARARTMRVRRKIVQKLWKRASAAEKATVREIYTQQEAHIVEDIFDTPIEDRTPEQIQSALDELPGIVAEFHAGIYTMTGWLGVTLLGGPTPEERGAVTQKTYCSGTSPGGLTLAESIQDWENVIRGVGQWLKRCNPREVRKQRSLDAQPMASDSSVISPNIPEPSLDKSTPPPTGTEKSGLRKKPTKQVLKQSRVAKRAAKAASKASATATEALAAPGPGFEEEYGTPDDLLRIDDQEPVHNGGAGMAPSWLHDSDIPIDPALCPTVTPTISNTLSPDLCATTAHVLGEHNNPIIQAFGALTPVPERPSYQSLESSVRGFVYNPSTPSSTPPVVTPPRTTTVLSPPPVKEAMTPRTTPPAPSARPATTTSLTSPPSTPPVLPVSTTRQVTPPVPPVMTTASAIPPLVPPVPPVTTTPRATPPVASATTTAATTPHPTHPVPAASTTLHATPPASPATTPTVFTPRSIPPVPSASATPRTTPPARLAMTTAAITPHPTLPTPPATTTAVTTPRSTPPIPPASTTSHATPPVPPAATPPVPVLSATAFPESRPLCNAPLEPKAPRTTQAPGRQGGGGRQGGSRGRGRQGGSRGRGRQGGSRGRGSHGGRPATARDAGFTFLQTYDENGQAVPLSLDTPLPEPSPHEVQQVRNREKARDKAAEAARAKEAWRQSLVHNPAGGADLIILPPTKPRRKDGEDTSLELPEGSKRVRKPAASREMPVPLSARPIPGAADARQAQLDQELLQKLQGGKQGNETKKRKRKDNLENSGADVESKEPVTKK